MNRLQIRESCAVLAGFEILHTDEETRSVWYMPEGLENGIPARYLRRALYSDDLPPFEESLNLLRWLELQVIITPATQQRWMETFWEVNRDLRGSGLFVLVTTNAAKRAEVLLKTFGLWRPGAYREHLERMNGLRDALL